MHADYIAVLYSVVAICPEVGAKVSRSSGWPYFGYTPLLWRLQRRSCSKPT